mgnify:CR=1 FL=1|jgi:hypothetical protein
MAIIKIGKRVCNDLYYLEIKSNGDNSCLIKNKHELLCRGPLQHCLNYRETIFNSLDTGYALPPDGTLIWQYTQGSTPYETVLASEVLTGAAGNNYTTSTNNSTLLTAAGVTNASLQTMICTANTSRGFRRSMGLSAQSLLLSNWINANVATIRYTNNDGDVVLYDVTAGTVAQDGTNAAFLNFGGTAYSLNGGSVQAINATLRDDFVGAPPCTIEYLA